MGLMSITLKEVYEILRKNQISEEIETYEDLANKITIDLTENIKYRKILSDNEKS